LIDLNILKKDQILEQGLAWANLNSRSGAAYAELAKYQVEAGNNEDAVINYLQAAVHAPVRNRTAYTQYYLDEAELLLSLDRVDAAMTWLDFFDRGRLDTNKKDEFEQVSRETRARFLADPERLQATLAEVRSGIAQDVRNYQSWRRLAEVTSAMAQQCIAASDYPKGLAFSKLSFYILNRLKPLDPKFDPSMFQAAKQDLSKGLLALGLGGQKRSLISKRSEWDFHYYHGGLKTSGWYGLNFMTDVSWKKGQAPFGYGDGDEATVLDFGKDKDNKPITGYFRKVFTVENPGDYNDLSLGVLHDDGMMVYLNGIQIARNNMPRTSIKPTSLAPTSRGSDVENKFWASKFKAQLLRKGLNVIAVEVHQNSEDSSDMGFDLEIAADALNTEEVIAEVESGSAMKPLKDWVDQLPPNWVGLLKGL
jgi:tetratricopeptide (TPR) repeat protein